MKNVAIVTDSIACVPAERVAEYGIEIVPVQLIFEGKTYRDGIDITPDEFYSRLRHAKKMPTSASSSSVPYLDAYHRASQKARSILCIAEPSTITAMYNSALTAMETARKTLKNVAIEVMESTTAAAGQGLVVLAAARAAVLDKTLSEVKEIASSVMSRVRLFAMLDTLQYLARSGRVPQAAHLVNSLLSIKPIFSFENGEANTVSLPRTVKAALNRIITLMDKNVVKGQALHVAVMHADALDAATAFKERIAARFDCREIFVTEFTPVMGVHTGPGLIGASFYGE
jgi:DegV family protein with EDD domain